MPDKIILNDNSFPKQIIVLSSQESSMRLSWIVGQAMNIEFRKDEEIIVKSKGKSFSFDNYIAIPEDDLVYRLVANHGNEKCLSKKNKNFDYFLLISNTALSPNIKSARADIQKAKGILGAFVINIPPEISRVFKNYAF